MAFLLPFLLVILPSPALSQDLQTGAKHNKPQPFQVLISDTCAQDGTKGKVIDLDPDSPLVLTHQIHLVPGTETGCNRCEVDSAALRARIERLEKEVSDLREKCGGPGACHTSQQSKGAVCTIVCPVTDDCPDDCNNQGRCVDGKCVCFPGYSGPNCSIADCPGNCNNRGKCLKGQCVCDRGFTGPDCSSSACPGNCSNRGRCVNSRCVCDPGFTGPSCATQSCPENCNNRGDCVNNKCVCNPGFTGPDCSVKTCPDNCNNRGRCANGTCVCEGGFTGPDCLFRSCPKNCSNQGKCLDGRCMCEDGFTGPDCSSKTCPNNCNNKGRCVNGKCVCDIGFSGQDCSAKTCPNNCSNRGRCMKGRCVCRRGYTGPSCNECVSGFTGDNCDTALVNISRLSTRDITESSVTLFWIPPAVQYDTYHITFTSMKETDQKIRSTISGRLTTYTQTGLAAGQEYVVTITGEKDGMMGADSTVEFSTLVSGPKDLQVVKTTTSSIIVQWDKAQGEIDRYVLSITPNQTDGSGKLPVVRLPPERDSAQIDGLEPGFLYDISLVAEKDGIQSLPATVQATPDNTLKHAARKTMTMQVDVDTVNNKELTKTTSTFQRSQIPRQEDQETKRRAEDSERTGNFTKPKTGILFRPVQKRPLLLGKNRTLSKPGARPDILRPPYSAEKKDFNSSRIGLGERRQIVPPSNKSVIWYPMRPKTTGVDSTNPISPVKPITQMIKKTHPDETLFRVTPVKIMKNATPSPSSQKGITTPSTTPLTFTESTEEPTITTEKNLTAYLNGTKCVRKVLVGYRKIHSNTTSEGNALSKNLTVIVGHINGNDHLHKLLTGRSIDDDRGFTGLVESQPTSKTSEARRSVKEKAGEKDIDAHEGEEEMNANVINVISSSARPKTTVYPILTTTISPAHLPLPPYLTRPGRVNQYTERDQSTAKKTPKKTIKPISIPRQPNTPPPSRASSAIDSRPLVKSTSLQAWKDKRPPRPSSTASRFSKEALLKKEHLKITIKKESQASTPEHIQSSTTESSPLIIKIPLKENTEKSNEGSERFNKVPFRRTPLRGSLSHHPYLSTFQNRSRQRLEPPQHPFRGPIRRPFPLKPIIINNRTIGQISSNEQVKPIITTTKQNSTSIQKPNIMFNRRNRTANILSAKRLSQIKPSSIIQTGSNISQNGEGKSDILLSTDHLTENGNRTQESVLNETDHCIEHVGVNNVTSRGFVLIWGASKGQFKHFTITHTQLEEKNKDEKNEMEGKSEEIESAEVGESGRESIPFTTVLPGSTRSHQIVNLNPQTRYAVSIFGKGPEFCSKTHNITVQTGPEPPSKLAFSNVTERSFTVSWVKPESKVSGFKVTYTNAQEGEPISVSVDSKTALLALSAMTPGSIYQVSVMSVLGQDESDSIKATVTTLPDPPTDLRAINLTDSKALLLWRPALATVDQYIIVYSSENASRAGITIKVSGNAAEQQLQALQASTEYRVTIQSQLGDLSSPETTTVFTTSGANKQGDGPSNLKASHVTPRTAVLSWKPPASVFTSYKLSYHTDGQEVKELILDPMITEYKLTSLYPMSAYTAHLQADRVGLHMTAISTEFTTGNLRFPFPTDCSQEKQNGALESGIVKVFPQGKQGKPVMVYCDMESDGGGWTVFQRRMDGKTNFFRGWREYSSGFGQLDEEFWLGNEQLYNFTKMSPMTLRVDLRAGDESVYAHYSSFSVDSQQKQHTLKVSGYSGTAGDSMTYHNGRPFSTWDRDPQPFITRCAMSYRGGWWYKNCHEANLNGLYNINTNHQVCLRRATMKGHSKVCSCITRHNATNVGWVRSLNLVDRVVHGGSRVMGVIWSAWKGQNFSIPFTEMKFRPASFKS